MDFDHENVRSAINGDRLSSLPDELIHRILSCIDSKYAVQTCLLSSRWKLLWTSLPCLNFASYLFGSLHKFSKFVTHVLSHRDHQIEVTSVKLSFHGAASQFFVRKIANYVFSHNLQELIVDILPKAHHEFPPLLFSSQSLKHFTLSMSTCFLGPCVTPKTPWNFPSLISLHLNEVTLCDDNPYKSLDLFSKCVNLKKLTLNSFSVNNIEVFDIITPQLSDLTLIDGRNLKAINLVAPQLENLTVINCYIKNLIAPPGLSTLSYRGYPPPQLSKEGFHSLNKVTISLYLNRLCKEEDARKTIHLLQEVHSARFLTLNIDIVECISSFPDLLSHHPSPFSDLICLNIDSSMRNDAYKVKMSIEARNFLLENSPNATFIMELPEAPPTKALKQKEAREKRKAKLVADIGNLMTELQASVELGKMHFEAMEGLKNYFGNHMAEARMFIQQKMMQNEQEKESFKQHKAEIVARFEACVGGMRNLVNQEKEDGISIFTKTELIRSLLEKLPKQQRAEIETHYCCQLEASSQGHRLITENVKSHEKFLADEISAFQNAFSSQNHLLLAPQFMSSGDQPQASSSIMNL